MSHHYLTLNISETVYTTRDIDMH